MSEHAYKRLTGRRRTLAGYSQLWLGPSHILLVNSTRFVEEYRRFALQDIQAIIVTALPPRTAIQIVGLIAAVLWTLGFFAVNSVYAKGAIAFTGVVALAAVTADLARGQRCRCYLQTAVSRELLAGVSRLKQANKFLAQVRLAIETVQGPLTAEHVVKLDAQISSVSEYPPEVLAPSGHVPEILFALLLMDAALVLLDQRFPRVQAGNLLSTTLIAEVVLVLTALLRRGPRARPLVHFLVILSLLCVGWDLAGMVQSLGASVNQVMDSVRHGTLVAFSFSWSPSRPEVLFAVIWRTAISVIGLSAAYLAHRKEVGI